MTEHNTQSFEHHGDSVHGQNTSQNSGSSLAKEPVTVFGREDYMSEEVYHSDKSFLHSQWICIDHVSSFPKHGDYKVCSVLGEHIIVVNNNGSISSYLNVCRHRASIICTEKQGNLRQFVCPYHGWAYDLDGTLVSKGSICSNNCASENLNLRTIDVSVLEGLIFVRLAVESNNNFQKIRHELADLLSWNGLNSSKIVSRKNYLFRANWKLVVENFLECYHCYPNHPDLCSIYSHPLYTGTTIKDKNNRFFSIHAQWEKETKAMGHPVGGKNTVIDIDQEQYVVAFRMPLNPELKSLAADGQPLSTLMGDIEQYDHGETFGYIGPLLHFSLLNDHCMLIRMDPVAPLKTEVQVTWLVDKNAREGVDFFKDQLTSLWDTTIKQDRAAVEKAQLGSLSSLHTPGTYTELEEESARFNQWYQKHSRAR